MLTPEQINEIRSKSGLQPLNQSNRQATNSVGKYDYLLKKPEKSGFMNELATRAGKVIDNTKKNVIGIADTYAKNKNLPATALSATAAPFKAIGEAAFEGAKMLAPEGLKRDAKEFINTVATNPKVKKDVIQPLTRLANDHPQTARAVEDLVDIISVLPAVKGVGAVTKAAAQGAKDAGKVVSGGVAGTGKIISDRVKKTPGLIKRASEKVTDIITPIESGVKTVISKPTTKVEKLAEYEKVAKDALLDYSKPTPLEKAGNVASKALESLQGKLKTYGEKKKSITQSIADTDTGSIVDTARQGMRMLLKDRVGLHFTETGIFRNAKNRLNTVSDPKDLEMIRKIDAKLSYVSKNPTFQRVDDAVDWMQDLLYKRSGMTAIPVNSKVETIIKNTIGELNGKLKVIGGTKYAGYNRAYSHTIGTFNKLNKALGAEGNKGASLMKQLFSPSGTAPRKLFTDIKARTGIDLVDEATLAKFVMENVGDVRQASLLEQVIKGSVPTNARGLIQMAAEKTIGKLQDPIGKARRLMTNK